MAGIRSFSILAAILAGFFCLTTCENALLGTVRAIVEESSDPLLVTIEPAAGTYTLPQSVQLSANKMGSVIRYTTDGSDPTAQTGTVYTGAISVPSSRVIRARAFLAPYSDSAVAVGDYTIPFGGQVKKFSPDAQVGDHFGQSVAIDGDYAIVGAPDADEFTEFKPRGAAYIYHRTGPDTWDDGVKIISTNPADEQCFGNSVDIDGDYAIVGNRFWQGTGSAYIFHRTGPGNIWDAGVKIDPLAPVASGYFGYAVSISGDYAVVGAFGELGRSGATVTRGGAAYLFHRTDVNTWADRTRIYGSDSKTDDFFGRSVSIDGDYIVVGDPEYDASGPTVADIGAIYLFRITGTTAWVDSGKFVSTVIVASNSFGWSVDISGNYAVAGAENETEGALNFAGAAYVIRRTGTDTWAPSCRITATVPLAGHYFGSDVAISGDYLIATAPVDDDVASNAGAIYSFRRTALNVWNAGPTAKWTPLDGVTQQRFGESVGIDGAYAIVGSMYCPGPTGQVEAGAAYILH